MRLITTNPQALLFKTNLLEITVLGGIQFSSLEKLRVTLKIKSRNIAIRQPLDLYNDDLIGKFVRKAAERLSLPTAELYKIVGELTEALEDYPQIPQDCILWF